MKTEMKIVVTVIVNHGLLLLNLWRPKDLRDSSILFNVINVAPGAMRIAPIHAGKNEQGYYPTISASR